MGAAESVCGYRNMSEFALKRNNQLSVVLTSAAHAHHDDDGDAL
jgi:hypothetical protein